MLPCIFLSPAALSFIPLNTYLSVPRGDNNSSSAVVPDVTFRFGTTTINSIYVSIVMKWKVVITDSDVRANFSNGIK